MAQGDRTPAAGVRETVLAACAPGRSGAVLIEGGPGLGKTALLSLVAEQGAAAGALVLTVAGSEWSRPLDAFRAELRGPARRGPVVLCADDVQDADPRSLHALREVVRYAGRASAVVAVTTMTRSCRWQEVFTAGVLRGSDVRRVRLALLGLGDTERALAAAGGGSAHPHAAARLHRLSGGNPLLLHALLAEDAAVRQPAADGPFARAVAHCLRGSGPAALATAHALAALGERPVDPALLAELVDGGGPEVLDGLSALRACGLLDGLGRREPAVRAATLAGCDAARRTRLRLRAAHALHAAGAGAVAVAGPLLALRADGARTPARPADRYLLAHTAKALAEAGGKLRVQGRRARADWLLRAARQLTAQAGAVAPHPDVRSTTAGHLDGRGQQTARPAVRRAAAGRQGLEVPRGAS